jgi:nucleoid DNA-binding protein
MSDYAAQLSDRIRAHLQGLIRSSQLPDTPESLEKMAQAWLEKKRMFEEQTRALDMQHIQSFSAEDPRGALLLTYSGSLVSLGPLAEGGRRLEYASIQLRTDVPHLLLMEGSALETELALDHEGRFREARMKHTSPLLQIAVCGPEVRLEEQEKRLREATIFLTNGFVKINRTVVFPGRGLPEQFTMKSMVTYVARRSGLTQKTVRTVITDYLSVVEAGILLGERVPLGRIARLSLKKRPPQKARVGMNPATGQKITIPARPEEAVPRARFGRLLKARARQVAL